MQDSSAWFACLALTAGMGWLLGWWLGRGSSVRTRLTLGIGFVLLLAWAALQRRPDLSVQIIPPRWMTYLEGTAAVPLFMLILGVAWSRARLPRQKRLTLLGCALGIVFFLQGGLWMVQTTPRAGLAQQQEDAMVFQSQDFTCVPAACATALGLLGVTTSEAEMAQYTRARPGTGSTLIRAVDGLERRLLRRPDLAVHVVGADYEALLFQPMPALTLVGLGGQRYRHMVTLLEVQPAGVVLADPLLGVRAMERQPFEDMYGGQVIVFSRRQASR